MAAGAGAEVVEGPKPLLLRHFRVQTLRRDLGTSVVVEVVGGDCGGRVVARRAEVGAVAGRERVEMVLLAPPRQSPPQSVSALLHMPRQKQLQHRQLRNPYRQAVNVDLVDHRCPTLRGRASRERARGQGQAVELVRGQHQAGGHKDFQDHAELRRREHPTSHKG